MDANNKLLSRGVEEIIIKEHLGRRLAQGEKLRIKFGVDPTAPDLHLGHTVALRKLKQFQDAGHKAVLIIGDFTAMIGDPSGRSESRKPLTEKEIKQNLKKYLKQAGKIIDIRKTEVCYNGKWFKKNEKLILELLGRESAQRILERDDFQKRFKEGREVMLLEMLYPLLQGYDSVMVKADVEIGGTDQKFNLLMGRRLQRAYGLSEQDVITLPLLEGTDGVKKMSKSAGNYIALDAEPDDMFGKIMSIPDNLIDKYRELLTDLPVESLAKENPREAKLELAKTIVGIYHGEKFAEKAKEEFLRVFSEHRAPKEIPVQKLESKNWNLMDLLMAAKMAVSKGEARRLIEQGAVRINDEKKTDPNEIIKIEGEVLLQVGPRKFLKLRPN
ncbi:MAG: tyrosine--tRNA ligase [Patescibacteria group bacterium]